MRSVVVLAMALLHGKLQKELFSILQLLDSVWKTINTKGAGLRSRLLCGYQKGDIGKSV
jgi:hypothetical protein